MKFAQNLRIPFVIKRIDPDAAAVGESFEISAIADLLGQMEAGEGLPDTVLFPLNMSDQAPLAVMQGSFRRTVCPPRYSSVRLGGGVITPLESRIPLLPSRPLEPSPSLSV